MYPIIVNVEGLPAASLAPDVRDARLDGIKNSKDFVSVELKKGHIVLDCPWTNSLMDNLSTYEKELNVSAYADIFKCYISIPDAASAMIVMFKEKHKVIDVEL